MKRKFLVLSLIAGLLITSCKKEITNQTPTPTPDLTSQQTNQLRTDFGKILAKAVANPQVQTLIKEESLKQFDNDYDVLFQLIKDKEIQPGVTLMNHLSSLGLTETMRNDIDNALPLLTIFVPNLSHFSAEKWNTSSDIPVVAVVNNDFSEKEHTPITAFDHQGNQFQLKSNKPPHIPVIVVKDNERIIASANNESDSRISRDNFIFNNQRHQFYFTGEQFNRSKTGTPPAETDKFNVSHYLLLGNSTALGYNFGAVSQRDYVYYGMVNSGDQGPLNLSYGEHLCGISFTPSSEYFLYDDATSDWSDGAFEFQLDVLLFNGSSALNKISKVFPVPALQQYFTNSETTRYNLPTPIPIATWDMKRYGDTWKYVLTEIDPGTVTTYNQSASTKIGTNYSFNSSTGEEYKIGTGFGSSIEQTFSNSITIQITEGSDFCGEAIVNYMSPVITGTSGFFYHIADVNTGIARMLIYPRPIQ
jgi:hypothetical protein